MALIRKATAADIPSLQKLLGQVLEIHAAIRPDLFKSGTRKYTFEELQAILADDDKPVFVGEEDGQILGYVFCQRQRPAFSTTMVSHDTLYIDDLCVDENARGKHIGTQLFEHVRQYAKDKGYYNITLHVWEGNDSARSFYEKSGFGYQSFTMEMIVK